MVRDIEFDLNVKNRKFKFHVPYVKYGDDNWWTSYIYRYYIKDVKSSKFQKLLFLLYIISYPVDDGGIGDLLQDRVNEIIHEKGIDYYREHLKSMSNKEENLRVLEIEEIMRFLDCSKPMAMDFKNMLLAIMRFFW